MTTEEAAAYCRRSPGGMRNMVSAGIGPRSYLSRGKRLYRRSAVDLWIIGEGTEATTGTGTGTAA